MWRTLLILSLASYTLAIPAPQGTANGSLEDWIKDIFENQNPTLGKPGNLEASTSSSVHLGVNNTPAPALEGCECVHYYQCQNGTITKDGIGIIDIRFGQPNVSTEAVTVGNRGTCSHYLDVCCKPPDVKLPAVIPPRINEVDGRCGKRNPNGIGFRITGQTTEAEFGEFPWMVAILIEETIPGSNEKLKVYQCGGSLIHKQAVLTAAHCVRGMQPETLKIRAGEWDTQTTSENFPHQDRNIQNIIVHENYYAGGLHNDFAILILTEPVQIQETVNVICLPDANTAFETEKCFASGWGKNKFGKEGLYQAIMKKVELPIIPNDICQDRLRSDRLGKYFELHESFICAGGELGKDTCKGDGGSPLVCPSKQNPEIYIQAGIVAWGIGCGEDGKPGVYANVAYARNWIDQQLTLLNLDNTVYTLKRMGQK